MDRRFELKARLRSFKYALAGIWTMLRSQHNAWLHLLATTFAIAAGFFFDLSRNEWCLILLAIMAVWTAEALNTAFEFLADAARPDFHPLVKKAKDVAAGGVLISALGAALVAAVIFGPQLWALFWDSALATASSGR